MSIGGYMEDSRPADRTPNDKCSMECPPPGLFQDDCCGIIVAILL